MKRAQSIAMITAATLVMSAGTVMAEADSDAPLYVALECMKSSSPDYERLETEVWLPVHEQLVEQGKRSSWALYRVVYGDHSRCDYYTVATYRGSAELNAAPEYEKALAAVHGKADVPDILDSTLAARTLVSTELWLQVDQTELLPHRYAIVNRMYTDNPVAYESMESEVFKAGHDVLIEGGHRAGWAVYALISPIGSSIPYNYGTVDFVNELGPAPMAEAMLEGNPDRNLEAMHELLELRDHVLSETWEFIAGTDAVR